MALLNAFIVDSNACVDLGNDVTICLLSFKSGWLLQWYSSARPPSSDT